ncbi:MAG: hypothetical protein ABIH17_10585 [Pseudomonadota bacterium]
MPKAPDHTPAAHRAATLRYRSNKWLWGVVAWVLAGPLQLAILEMVFGKSGLLVPDGELFVFLRTMRTILAATIVIIILSRTLITQKSRPRIWVAGTVLIANLAAGGIVIGVSAVLAMYGPAVLYVAGVLPVEATQNSGTIQSALGGGALISLFVWLHGYLSFFASLPFALPFTYQVFRVSLFELTPKPIWKTCSELPEDMRDPPRE